MIRNDRVLGTPRTNSSSLSRRQAIAGLALLPATLSGALVAAAAEPDPIYASIEACRNAKRASDAAFDKVGELNRLAEKTVGSDLDDRNTFVARIIGEHPDDYIDGPMAMLWKSYEELARTVPATREGLYAMLDFVGEVTDRTPDVFNDGVIFSTLATAAKTLMRA
jgi:hypothetical protein